VCLRSTNRRVALDTKYHVHVATPCTEDVVITACKIHSTCNLQIYRFIASLSGVISRGNAVPIVKIFKYAHERNAAVNDKTH